MTAPYGRHARSRSTVSVALRHALLWLLPTQPKSHDSWHTVWCALGDLAEDFFSLLAVAGIVAAGAITALILVWLSPVLLLAAVVLGLITLGTVRMRAAVGDFERIVDQEAPR